MGAIRARDEKDSAGWRGGLALPVGCPERSRPYLGAEGLQLRRRHADQLHSLLIIGDGTRQVGHLRQETRERFFQGRHLRERGREGVES